MKKQGQGALGVALLAAALAVVSVPGEAQDLRCNVPFRFEVRDATLPAGTYTVTVQQSTLMIRSATQGAFAIGNRVEKKTNDTPKLVFHRYGDAYILREVWTGSLGREIPESRRERELKTREVARFETVVIPLS
jgi:hypothetical protein